MKKSVLNNGIWLAIIAFIVLMAYRSYLKRNPVEKDVDQDTEMVDHVESFVLEEPESEFKGNQLLNGSSPFDKVYGDGQFSDNSNTLLVKNQSGSDVIVFLKTIGSEEVIRNHYIRAHSQYLLQNIPNKTCYTKFYYGKDWNPNRKVKGLVTGGFETNEDFVDTEKDIMEFREYEDGNYIYFSQFEITLETIEVEGQTMSERKVAASEFF
ncbi:MAG: hypothetical protein O2U61_01270 [Candidatus Bathyarchaeota archaeon]|nr:hypothetical protein [Candidatus Bathyarchaeota archaeon]